MCDIDKNDLVTMFSRGELQEMDREIIRRDWELDYHNYRCAVKLAGIAPAAAKYPHVHALRSAVDPLAIRPGRMHTHYKNKVICSSCGDTLESMYRHDFQVCGCPAQTFTDGGVGNGYVRRGGVPIAVSSVIKPHEYAMYRKLNPGMDDWVS